MQVFQFAPSTQSLFQFQPTLDGQVYTCVVTWSLFGQRGYLNIFSLAGTRIVSKALVGSPNDYDINLIWGYFTTSTMVFREASQQFEVVP